MIEMKKIADFNGFRPDEFCIYPKYWEMGYEYPENVPDSMAEAIEKAKEIDGICVAIIHPDDEERQYAIGVSAAKGCAGRFVLFNAETVRRSNAEVRAVVFNTGRGARTRYWVEKLIRYQPGSIIQ